MDIAHFQSENPYVSVKRIVKTEPVDTVAQYIDGESKIYQSLEDAIKTETNCDTPKSKKFKCESCYYSASTKGILKTHVNRIHLKLRDHACHLCNYETSAKEILKNHINRVHLRLKDHKCHLCDHSTHNKYLLKTHIETVHWDEDRKFINKIRSEYGLNKPIAKKFECNSCNFSSNTKGILKKHFDTVHLKLREHKCHLCDYQASTKYILDNHISRVHLLKRREVKGQLCEDSTQGNPQESRVELIHKNRDENANRFGEDEIQSKNNKKAQKKCRKLK